MGILKQIGWHLPREGLSSPDSGGSPTLVKWSSNRAERHNRLVRPLSRDRGRGPRTPARSVHVHPSGDRAGWPPKAMGIGAVQLAMESGPEAQVGLVSMPVRMRTRARNREGTGGGETVTEKGRERERERQRAEGWN